MRFALLKDGQLTGREQEFDQAPDPNQKKGFEWVPVQDPAPPAFNEKTHKVVVVKEVKNGVMTRKKQAVALSESEKADLEASEASARLGDLAAALVTVVNQIDALPGIKTKEMTVLITKAKAR